MAHVAKHLYAFGPFRVDALKRVLLNHGKPISLQPKAFDTLLVLVENSGKLVEKDSLMKALWPDTFVEEANLSQNVSLLRKALGESPGDHRYIVTVPGRGYSFVAPVTLSESEEVGLGLKERDRLAAEAEERESAVAP